MKPRATSRTVLAAALVAAAVGIARGDEGEGLRFVRETLSREGWRFLQTAQLGEKVLRRYEHDGKIVTTEKGDWRTAYECEFEILRMEGDEVREAKARFRKAELADKDGEHDLKLAGKTIVIRGVPGKREFFFEDETRPDEHQAAWLEAHFDEADGKRPDPRALFLPEEPVPADGTWKLAPGPIGIALGVPKGELAAEESTAGGHLDKVYDQHGKKFADVTVDVTLARSALEGAPLKDGKLVWKGIFQLPVDGSVPYGALEHHLRFSGITVAYRGSEKYVIHFSVEREGKVVAVPVE